MHWCLADDSTVSGGGTLVGVQFSISPGIDHKGFIWFKIIKTLAQLHVEPR